MPTSIAITIARQLGADAPETERVLETLVQEIRHDVARNGHAVVPGLGIFRFFDETIVFEPDSALALAINHRYAGLESLLVSGSDIRHSHPTAGPHEKAAATIMPEFGTLTADSEHLASQREPDLTQSEDDVEEPDVMVGETLATSLPPWQEQEAESAVDEAMDLEEVDDAAPPPEYTEIVPTGFDPETHEILGHEQGTGLIPAEAHPPFSEAQPDEEWAGEEGPDLMAETPPYVRAIPALDGSDVDPLAEEDELEDETTAGEPEPDHIGNIGWHEEPESDVNYQEPSTSVPELSASPFFEPWPEDLPDLDTNQAARIYPEPEEEPLSPPEPNSDEPHVDEPVHLHDQAEEAPEASFEPENAPADVHSGTHTTAYEEPDRETSGAPPPVVENHPEPEPLTAPVFESTRSKEIVEEPRRKTSLTPWLVAAVAILGIAIAYVFLTSRPDVETPPAQIAQNDPAPVLPSDTMASAPTDTAGALVDLAEPAATGVEPPAENVSPMRRPGGIDVDAGGLTLIVASTPSRTSAEAVAERFRQQGFTTAIFYGEYGGVTRYRVGVGQFSDQRTAETQLGDLPEGFPNDAWPMPIRSEMEISQ